MQVHELLATASSARRRSPSRRSTSPVWPRRSRTSSSKARATCSRRRPDAGGAEPRRAGLQHADAELLEQFPTVAGSARSAATASSSARAPGSPRASSLADRPYFQRLCRASRSAISGYIIGRLSGQPHLNFAYPAVDGAGEVRAVVVLAFSLGQLSATLLADAAAERRDHEPGRRRWRPARPRAAGARPDRGTGAARRLHPGDAGPARRRDGGRPASMGAAHARLCAAVRLRRSVRGGRAAVAEAYRQADRPVLARDAVHRARVRARRASSPCTAPTSGSAGRSRGCRTRSAG